MSEFEICNFTLQRRIYGIPHEFLGSSGFVRLAHKVPEMRFVKKKNDQVNMLLDINSFVPSGMHRPPGVALHRVIISNCSDGAVIMKVLGSKCKSHVVFVFRVFQEILGSIADPGSGLLLDRMLRYENVETTNIVAKWQIPAPLPTDFDIMKMEFGERCSCQMSKIPLMRMKHPPLESGGKKLSVNVSMSGMCTTLGVKDVSEIPERQERVKRFFERIESLSSSRGGRRMVSRESSLASCEAAQDRLNFVKSVPHFRISGKGVRCFNKSKCKKRPRSMRWEPLGKWPRAPRMELYVMHARKMYLSGLLD